MWIKTKRLLICDLLPDMVTAIQRNSLDPENRRFVPDEVFETFDEAETAVRRLIEAARSPEGPFLYPVLTAEGENIGYVQACGIDAGWEVGYHIAAAVRRRGYATEAVSAFLPVILPQLRCDHIYGIVLEENVASQRVLEHCGFRLLYRGPGRYQGEQRALRRYLFERI